MKNKFHPLFIFLLSLYWVSACNAGEQYWLPIIGTFTSSSDALKSLKKLGSNGSSKINLISSNDCENIKPNLIIMLADSVKDKKNAQKKVNYWKKKGVSDAYIKPCDMKKNSNLSLNVPIIDNSFKNLDSPPINWGEKETLSSVKIINDNQALITHPYYIKDPEDVREGLRTKIELRWINSKKNIVLSNDCIDPYVFTTSSLVGFSCVTEVAAMNLLHKVNIFTIKSGKAIKVISRCRSPKIVQQQLQCLKETMSDDGELQLTKTTISF